MADEVSLLVGRRLRHRRKLLGLTQLQVAAVCGVTFQQIQKYESGKSALSATHLWLISQLLGVPVSFFFEGLPTDRPVLTPRTSNGHRAVRPEAEEG